MLLAKLKEHNGYIVAGAGVATVFWVFIYVVSGTYSYVQARYARDTCRSQYPHTSRTLGCISFDTNSERMQALNASLDKATAVYVGEGKATRVSIFVRDLVSQQWAASNENEVYAPASLMKLPLLIAYYKISELDPSIFSEALVYKKMPGFAENTQDFKPADPLVLGKTYTIEQVIDHMIVNSDNDAADLLYANVNPDIFNQTAIDLGINIPVNKNTLDFVTAKTYAGVIRMLYNSSYLNRDSSEKVLTLMSKTAFRGIANPLPSSVTVAHKFGEREVDAGSSMPVIRELHDCGVVYKTPNPYIICVMTEGKDFDDLLSVLNGLSRLVYENI